MNFSLIKRTLSALISGLILFIIHMFFKADGLYVLCIFVFMIIATECGTLVFKKKRDFLFLLPFHLIHFISFYLYPNLNNLLLFCLVEIIVWMWAHRKISTHEESFYSNHSKLYIFLFYSLIAPTFLLTHLVMSPRFESVYFLFFIVALFDTFSYFWGKLFGGKLFLVKLYPLSSPSKTIEGALLAGLTCIPITLVLDQEFREFSFLQRFDSLLLKILLSSLILLAALTGDLTESVIKRTSKIKDSGNFLPGHGGFFDRLDGLLFASILSYLLLQF